MNDLSFTWDNIHLTAKNVPPTDVPRFNDWLIKVAHNSPCGVCRNHMLAYISAHAPKPDDDLFVWTWRFHNQVNTTTGKSQEALAVVAARYNYILPNRNLQ